MGENVRLIRARSGSDIASGGKHDGGDGETHLDW
jgi:hypothetical protein